MFAYSLIVRFASADRIPYYTLGLEEQSHASLFPYGLHGMCNGGVPRAIPISPYMYVRQRLRNYEPRFRRNLDWLFMHLRYFLT
jgi:hypothetical protein